MDITQLILDDHQEQRRLFAMIDDIDPSDTHSLTAIWRRLSTFLEVHAETEEKIFYPALLQVGRRAGEKEEVEHETKHAIKDHNEIRDTVNAVADHDVGSDEWFEAVAAANEANSDHMGEEEREGLTHFRKFASLDRRHELGVAFVTYEVKNVIGVVAVDKNPKEFVEQH